MPVQAYNILLIQPHNYPHSAAFHEVAWLLQVSLQSLGCTCTLTLNQPLAKARNIVLGYHLLTDLDWLPHPWIIYQFEQLSAHAPARRDPWLRVLKAADEIWDYSETNIHFLASCGILQTKLVPLGFHPALQTIQPAPMQDIDVLAYGTAGGRRQPIYDALSRQCRFKNLFGVYGAERNAWIARAKLVLNVHLYPNAIMEQVRVSYLLNNKICVVSEDSPENPFADGLTTVAYDHVVGACLRLLEKPDQRIQLAAAGYEYFSRRPMTEILRPLVYG